MSVQRQTHKPVSNQTAHWQAMDAEHHIHPFTDHTDLAEKGVRVITKAEGVYLYDSEGERLLDAMAGLWCCNLGYGNQEIAEAGYQALQELPYYNTFFQTTHPYVVDLSEKLASLTPGELNTFYWGNSGSEANDNGVKIIRYYWNLQGKPNKKIILSRENAYHGSTAMAASLTGLTFMHPQFDLPLPGIEHVGPAPYWYGEGGEMSEDDFGLFVVEQTEKKILALGPDNVAAFIAEPIMGAAGVRIPPDTYWPALQKMLGKYDILLWADEVITAFGRTNNWFGSNTYNIEPDLMTMAKAMSNGSQPISALAMGPRVANAMKTANEEFAHGMTYAGHPVAAAVALKTLEILERTDLPATGGRKVSDYFQQHIRTLADHPLIGEVRGVGFIGAIELTADRTPRKPFPSDLDAGYICREHCFNNGLVMRASGNTMLLSPPLIITKEHVDEIVTLARKCFDLTANDIDL